jgi:hypothetical protein
MMWKIRKSPKMIRTILHHLPRKMSRTEVQAHGFTWEKNLLQNIYGATEEEIKTCPYTNKMDCPAALNRKDGCDLSIKTTCSAQSVCMADCLRIFDAVHSGSPFHMVVVQYNQDDNTQTKRLVRVTEVDLTNSTVALFGSLTREQIEELDKAVKAVPQKRKPTQEEYDHMYGIRDRLQPLSGAIHLDIKCNSTQSRLQCSFNRFPTFLEKNPSRIVATSTTSEFRGGKILTEVSSGRRVFKKSLSSTPPDMS